MFKIDINKIIEQITALYASGAGWYMILLIFIVTAIVVLFLFLKKNGYFKSSVDSKLESILQLNTDMKNGYVESFGKIFDLQNQILRNMDSKLTIPQVDIIVGIQMDAYVLKMFEALSQVFVDELDSEETDIKLRIREEIINVILNEDEQFFRLPSTEGAMISLSEKLDSVEESGIISVIYSLMIKHRSCYKDFHRTATKQLSNFIVKYWKTR